MPAQVNTGKKLEDRAGNCCLPGVLGLQQSLVREADGREAEREEEATGLGDSLKGTEVEGKGGTQVTLRF